MYFYMYVGWSPCIFKITFQVILNMKQFISFHMLYLEGFFIVNDYGVLKKQGNNRPEWPAHMILCKHHVYLGVFWYMHVHIHLLKKKFKSLSTGLKHVAPGKSFCLGCTIMIYTNLELHKYRYISNAFKICILYMHLYLGFLSVHLIKGNKVL